MIYHNPLHIIPASEVKRLNAARLQAIREQLLKEIAASTTGTIKVQGRTYHKQQILDIFEDFDLEEIHFHFEVFQYSGLQAFLETGKLDFFEKADEWKVLNNHEFRTWIKPFFVKRLSEVYYQAIVQKNIIPFQVLQGSFFRLPKDWEIPVLTKSIKHLHQWLEGLQQRFAVPTMARKRTTLRPEIAKEIDTFYMDMFDNLPKEYFNNLKYRYGSWCQEVLQKVLGNDEKMTSISKATLPLLQVAASNASRVMLPNKNKQLVKDIEEYIQTGTIKPKEKSLLIPRLLIFGIPCLLIFFLVQLGDRATMDLEKDRMEYLKNKDIAAAREEQRVERIRTQLNFRGMRLLENTATNIPYYEMEVNVGKFSDVSNIRQHVAHLYKRYAKHDIKKTTYLWLKIYNPYQVVREYRITAYSYSGKLRLDFYREPLSPKDTLNVISTADYQKNYQLFGEIHEDINKVTNFSGYIDFQRDQLSYRVQRGYYRGKNVKLSEIKSSDFVLKESQNTYYKQPMKVKLAWANYFALQGLQLTYNPNLQEKVSIYGGRSFGLLDIEEGFLKWEDSPYLNVHQLKVKTDNFVVTYFVNKKTGIVEEMEMLNNKSDEFARTVIFCNAK